MKWIIILVVYLLMALYFVINPGNNLKISRIKGKVESFLFPGYSTCGRCGRPWKCVDGHTTMHSEGLGCFPLCESCWSALTPKERLPHYRKMYEWWESFGADMGNRSWVAIEKAVLEGK